MNVKIPTNLEAVLVEAEEMAEVEVEVVVEVDEVGVKLLCMPSSPMLHNYQSPLPAYQYKE